MAVWQRRRLRSKSQRQETRHRRPLFEALESRTLLAGIPQLHSNPSASAKLFLDFNGNFESNWFGYTNVTTPAYDRDGDPATFSDAETAAMSEIWARVAEDYAPFNIDVTTIDPGNRTNKVTAAIAIGGSAADWYGSGGGVAGIGGFYNSASNVGFVFEDGLGNGDPKYCGEAASHESGHLFGLNHQSVWNGTNLVDRYNPGNGAWAPIMGNSYSAPRTTWHNGVTDISPTSTEDALAILSNNNNNFGYKSDDFGSTRTTAAALPVTGTSVNFAGLIGRYDDQDVWSLVSPAGQLSLQLNVAEFGANLDAVLELQSSSGSVLVTASPSDSQGASLTTTVAAGTYYLVARSLGDYGDMGQYTISGSLPSATSEPEVTVRLGGSGVLDGQTVTFGPTNVGAPAVHTFTVINEGNTTLTLANPVSLPAGFSLAPGLASTSLPAGQSTTFALRLDAAAAGTFSGPIALVNNDADENPFDLTLTGTVYQPGVTLSPTTVNATEGGATGSYTVVLTGLPTANVTITPSPGSQVTVNPPTLTFTAANWNTPQTVTVTAVDDPVYEGNHGGAIAHAAASTDPAYSALTVAGANVQITDNETPTLSAGALVSTTSGFTVTFNRPIAISDLNLYDSQTGTLGPADVTLVGAGSGTVRGSLIAGPSDQQFTFIKTGGPLVPDTYSVVLRSAANGFHDALGAALDGDANGLAGGDYTTNFTVAAGPVGEVTIGVPDFARGFGQAVNLPLNATAGIPITLSTGQNVTSVDFDLAFDPALLSVVGFATQIAGAAAAFNVVSPGLLRVTISSATPFSSTAGAIELGRLAASVPPTAPYGAKAVLDLTNVIVEDGATTQPVRVDDGVQITAFAGDTSGNGTYSGGDTTLHQRFIVGSGSGYTAFPLLDPALLSDINKNSSITGGDTTLLQRLTVGMPIDQAPTLPAGLTFPAPTGPDPRLFIPTDLAGLQGQIVTVPVMLQVTELAGISLTSVDLVLEFDFTKFTASNFRVGGLLAGSPSPFSDPVTFSPAANTVTVTMFSVNGPNLALGAEGPVLLFDLTVNPAAQNGIVPLNLRATTPGAPTVTGLEDNNVQPLVLVPAPTNATNDSVDGRFRVGPPPGVIVAPTAGLATTEAGGTATFSVTLNSQPTADVTIGLSSNNTAEGAISASSLVFTSTNWNTPQIVTVTGVNDFLDDGDTAYTIVTAAAVSADPSYTGLNGPDVSVTNTDDDTQGLVVSVANVTVTEGATNTFTVRLAAQPTADVTASVARTTGDTDVSVSSGAALTFTSSNWSTPQTVTLAAAEDADAVNGSATITVASAGLTSQLVTASENDNDSEITVTISGANVADGQTVDIGAAVQGTPLIRTFTVTNDGNAPLTLTSINPAGLPAGFTLSANFGQTTLNSGQSTTFAIQLEAAVPGAKSGSISFANNDANENPFDLTLNGTVTAPEITVTLSGAGITDAQTVDFGTAVQGTPITRTFTVTNTGTATLDLTGINPASLPAGFTFVSGFIAAALGPGEFSTFEIRLDATVPGVKSGSISFANNDADENPFDLTLSGTVTAPEIAVTVGGSNVADGGTVSFGTAIQGTPLSQTLTVTNIGTATLSLTNINPASLPAGFTLVSGFSSTSLGPGQFTTFEIRLDAVVPGLKSGSIALASNDLDENPFDLTLSGTVTAPEITVTLGGSNVADSAPVNFGTAVQGTPVSQLFTVTNVGTAALSLTNINPASLPAGFTLVSGMGSTSLGSGQFTTFEIRLEAVVPGLKSGNISFANNDLDENPFDLTLTGTVTAPEITVTRSGSNNVSDGQTVNIGTVIQGTPDSETFTVTNTGTAALNLTNIDPASMPAGFTLVSGFGSTELGPGQFTTFVIRLDAVVPGVKSGSFSFANNDANENPFDIGLSGNVIAREVVVVRSSGLSVTEAGGTDTYMLVLSLQPTANVTVTTQPGTQLATNPPAVTFTPANWSIPQTITVSAIDDLVFEGSHSGTITHSVASADAGYQGLPVSNVTVQIIDNEPPTLGVTSLVPTPSGFIVSFNRPIAVGDLNLYDALSGALGPADVTLVGATTGAVRGSLLAAAGNQQFTFLQTGGPLAADTYTVTFRSAANGFHDVSGVLLDGDANGLAGGDYVTSFAIAAGPANEVTLGIPDFARGFGQAVNLPLTTTPGIPLTLSTGQNVTSAAFDLAFDPALLNMTGFTTTIAGANATFSVVSPGLVRVSVISAMQFSAAAGPIELGRLAANVPETAPYAAKAVLDLTNVVVQDGAVSRPVRVDDGVQIAAYAGDANGNGAYSGGDTTLLQRYVVGSGTGLTAFQLADPVIVGDLNRNGVATGGDTMLVQKLVVGMPITEAPTIPVGLTPPPPGGPDPKLYIPRDLTGLPGQTVTVPVMLQVTDPAGISVGSLDLVLEFDPARFTASNFRIGGLLAGAPSPFSPPVTFAPAPGTVTATLFSVNGPVLAAGAEGAVLLFDLTVAPDAQSGPAALNLRQSTPGAPTRAEITNNSVIDLILAPAPTNGSDDPIDGQFHVGPLALVADIVDVAPDPRRTAVGLLALQFSSAVTGLDVADFRLTHDGAAVPLAGVVLSGSGANYSLDLAMVTQRSGSYVLSLVATGSGISDAATSAPLSGDAVDAWRNNPWHNFTQPLDTNAAGGIVAIDALVVFNELNNRVYSDPVTGLLPVQNDLALPELVDVNDDGRVTAIDALLVINHINLPSGGPEGESATAPILPSPTASQFAAAPLIEQTTARQGLTQHPASWIISDDLLELLANPRLRWRRSSRG